MKIWMRIGKANLTYGGRSVYGTPITYDETIEAFNLHNVECVSEYPEGDFSSAKQFIPPNSDEYMTMWDGDPLFWDIKRQIGRASCRERV